MNNQIDTGTGDWYDKTKKEKAVLMVLQYLATHRQEGLECVADDAKAAELFRVRGGIDVPEGARVIFFATGEQALEHGASVSLEIPSGPASDEVLLENVLGNYPYWPTKVPKPDQRTGSVEKSNSGTTSVDPKGK